MPTTELLILGAGPYGLATAAYARHLGIDFTVVGSPLEYWRHRMPKGVLLRSGSLGQLDPLEINTLERYLHGKGFKAARTFPLAVDVFVGYADWFMDRAGITTVPSAIRQLERRDGRYEAFLENGETWRARNVAVAPGLDFFRHLPPALAAKLPRGRYTHSCAMVNFEPLAGRRCLVIGGRQSAFEWTALMLEAGVAKVHVAFRHETPRFAPSDWSWINPLVQHTVETRGWYRRLPRSEKRALERRFHEESRLKLEPWLGPRISKPNVTLWPQTRVESCATAADGSLRVRLSGGAEVEADHIVLAIGYRVDMRHVRYLSKTSVLRRLKTGAGYPALDEHFQTSLPGLFVTGLAATRDFGPLFSSLRGCPASAKIIGDHVRARAARGARE